MNQFTLFITFAFLILFSCKSDKQSDLYIDIKIQSTREYTSEERAKIKEASKRFYEHVEIKNNQGIVTARNGDEIGIPNEFFYLFKMGIDDANDLARETGYQIEEPNQ